MLLVIKNDKQLFTSLNKAFDKFQRENEYLFAVDISNDVLNDVFKKHVQKTPIFRERPVWDCSCCRHSMRQIARVVAVDKNYKKVSFLEYVLKQYDLTANYSFLHEMFLEYVELIKSAPICGIFYSKEPVIGVEKSLEARTGLVFNHFYFNVNPTYMEKYDTNDRFHGLKATVSKYHSHIDILKDVIFYIKEGYIYRGAEKLAILEKTISLLSKYKKGIDLDLFVWKNIFNEAAFFNNDVISTLVDDLIEGKDTEKAINEYNKKVSPENYRQTKTTVVTPTQIKQCELELEKLGYKDFIEGFSFATPQDISVLDVLWTNRKVSKGRLSDLLADNVKQPSINSKNVSEISFSEYVDLLENAKDIEVDTSVLEKVVLIKDDFEQPVFAWGNHINFCYQTGLADVDMVSKRVKEKGGNIDAKIRFSLYWENLDDLDLHLKSKRVHIDYSHKRDARTSFQLDIDMNVRNPIRGAVENIYATKICQRDIGQEFVVFVHNYTEREQPQNCLLNVYYDNKLIKQYSFKNPIYKKRIELLKFILDEQGNLNITWSNKQAEKPIKPEVKFVKVDTVLLSPNYWEKGAGNKHIFFLKKGESIELSNIRPYNIEQLRPELVKHRKVLQLLSHRIEIKGKPQLVGWGISFSKKRELPVRINGRPYKLIINPTEELIKSNVEQLKVANI